jgi:hypothetical protein
MAVRERRRGNQANPQDKANYLIICGFFLTLWLMLLKSWSDSQFTVVVGFVGTILGALGGFLTGRMHAQQQTDTAVNTGSVENMTVKTDQQPAPANEVYYQDDGNTKELTPDRLRELGLRR